MFNFLSKFTKKKLPEAQLVGQLTKPRKSFTERFLDLVIGKKNIDEEVYEHLYSVLVMSDMGISLSERVMTSVRDRMSRKEAASVDTLLGVLEEILIEMLTPYQATHTLDESSPHVIMMVGVNGVGKTTSIGKLAYHYLQQGKKPLLACGDTFRAAAIEQLKIWGQRNDVPVIAQKHGSDSAAVVFDACQSAKATGIDVMFADTAGRIHTKDNLMKELSKIGKVLKKIDAKLPQDVWLVLDATTGQNGLSQALKFKEFVNITGVVLTKLDGTAKGGIVFSVLESLQVPIYFIGVGEGIEDLIPFNPSSFVSALLSRHV